MKRPTAKPIDTAYHPCYRITIKATGETCYAVPSYTTPGIIYCVRWNAQAVAWQCNCPSVKPCKHERLVNTRRAQEYKARVLTQPQLHHADVLRAQRLADRGVEKRDLAPLHNNREFSLMR